MRGWGKACRDLAARVRVLQASVVSFSTILVSCDEVSPPIKVYLRCMRGEVYLHASAPPSNPKAIA